MKVNHAFDIANVRYNFDTSESLSESLSMYTLKSSESQE